MDRFLSDYIQTQSSRRREKIYDLLEEVRVSRDSIDVLFARLSSTVSGLSPLQTSAEVPESIIEGGKSAENIRQIGLRIRELYGVSNLISLLLNSHVTVLDEEISGIESDIYEAEKAIQNYAFLLADGKSFDYAYLEPFSDEISRDFLPVKPDRTYSAFGSSEEGEVKLDEGVLVLPQLSQTSYGISARITNSNCSARARSDTGIRRVTTPGNEQGWTVRVDAPSPIRTSLRPGQPKGAQFELEFQLQSPAAISQITMNPFSGIPVDVLSIRIYGDAEDESKYKEILTSKSSLDRKKSFRFSLQAVSKFVVLINQDTYTNKAEVQLETSYDRLVYLQGFDKSQGRISIPGARFDKSNIADRRRPAVKRASLNVLGSTTSRGFRGVAYSTPPTTQDLRDVTKKATGGLYTKWRADENRDSKPILRTVIDQAIRTQSRSFRSSRKLDEIGRLFGIEERGDDYGLRPLARNPRTDSSLESGILSRGRTSIDEAIVNRHSIPATMDDPNRQLRDGYMYSVGLKTVSVANTSPSYRGMYTSKTFTSPGDIGQIRMKVSDQNAFSSDLSLDSKQLTSLEYSVSDHPRPDQERHWIPILPVGLDDVQGERLILSSNGRGRLRFPAEAGSFITVYKNGLRTFRFRAESEVPGSITVIEVPPNSIAKGDIYTVDYIPLGDPTTVDFDQSGSFSNIPLTTAFDETGAGEGFAGTSARNMVTLKNLPYVDEEKVTAGDNITSYTPITVVFDDGTIASNITDYQTGSSQSLFSDQEASYVHSGQKLLFNKPITRGFRVYYKYLENNVRFRVVLRCNVKDFVSPEVDYVQVKAKIRKATQGH